MKLLYVLVKNFHLDLKILNEIFQNALAPALAN